MKQKWIALGLCAAVAFSMLSGCKSSGAAEDTNEDNHVQVQSLDISQLSTSDDAVFRTPATMDLADAVTITLNGSSVEIGGNGASESGGVISITSGGTYAVSGTLDDGCIIVDAKNEAVVLALNGADITCSNGSPLYIYKSELTTIHLVEGTENTLTDGAAYTLDHEYYSLADEEPDACLYSKSDLMIQGAGALKVNASYKNGVTSKDTLEVYDLTLTVNAANNGVNGKDSNTIDSARITVNCGGDAIRSTNDADETLGWISISNSILDLTSGGDGIQAQTSLTMSSGSYAITSGGGSSVEPSDEDGASAKGIKSEGPMLLFSGVYTLDCSDDALHSGGNLEVTGGIYTISSYDDGFHSDADLNISGGTVDVLTSYEGLEGLNVNVSGGELRITSSDDGVNAAGGADGSGFMGFGHGNTFGGGGSGYAITISGGYLDISAGGDGIDSNGSLTISGGTVLVDSASSMDNVALDCQSSCVISGGTVVAASYGTMVERSPGSDIQCILSISFDSALPAGTFVEIKGESQSFVLKMDIETNLLVFSSPGLVLGADYTISYGGTYNGTVTDGVGQDGIYSGGTELTTLTLSDCLTSYGRSDMGGNRGGMGGNRGGMGSNRGGMGTGNPAGGKSENPATGDGGMLADGAVPEIPSGGMNEPPTFDGTTPAEGTAPSGGPGGQRDGNRGGTPREIPVDGSSPPEIPT